ncbi:MAG: amino acid permease, partial [Cellulomonas sp.]|nr:amino acid permease [Cellulomonas sp.]
MKKTLLVGLVLIMFAPLVGLLGAATLANPALTAQGACLTPGLGVLAVPDALQVTTGTGATISLDHQQLTHAATIIDTGARTPGVGYDGILVALMAALTESRLRQLANTSAYPDSATYPNDGDGADHDSLGLFQMRPAAGWGTVAQLMDPGYQARAFYGGPAGPNAGSPRGLLDIPGWQQLTPGQAAQAVEVSAFPDRYQTYQPAATSILATLTTAPGPSPTSSESPMPETGSLVFPLPAGTYVRTSGYGMRDDPLTGQRRLHAGVDWAAPAGTPILALADGLVWCELASAFPGSGGTYHFFDSAFGESTVGRSLKFLFVWQFLFSGPLEIATGAIGLAQYLCYFAPGLKEPMWNWGTVFPGWDAPVPWFHLVGLGVMGLVTFLAYRRIEMAGRLVVVLWVGMLATVGWVIVAGLWNFDAGRAFDFPEGAWSLSRRNTMGLGMALAIAMYDFLGYYQICYLGDEVADPSRTIPRAILISV